jgi:predicted nuclease of restriction endonuclease-like (RecB) superfamily
VLFCGGRECAASNWSVRQLERQITTFYYERLLATQKSGKESAKNEIQKTEPKTGPDYILKDPYILKCFVVIDLHFKFSGPKLSGSSSARV